MGRPLPYRDVRLSEEFVLPQLVRRRATETPDEIFVHEVDGETKTYRELHEGALGFARLFESLGIGRDDTVATFLFASIEALEVWIGLAWRGAVEAALNTEYRHQLLVDVLNDTRATTVVTTTAMLETLRDVAGNLQSVQRVVLLDTDASTAAGVAGWTIIGVKGNPALSEQPSELVEPRLEATSNLLYTSGTTGPSKGVIIPWAQMLESGRTIVPVDHLDNTDVFYCPYAPCHITGKAYFYSMLLVGGEYVIKRRFRTSEFWSDVQRYGCTSTLLQGAMAHFLLNQKPAPEEVDSSLSKIIVAPVIAEVTELERRFGVRVGTAYNMTELSCPLVSEGWENDGPGSCGGPRAGVIVRLVDELDNEVRRGEVGELVVRHDDPWTMTVGYLRRPEATVQANRNNWFHTGDAFYQDDEGRFFFVDRIKDSIRRRGENISSLEIEREVRTFPAVKACAAVAARSEFGEDDVRVVVVAEPGEVLVPAELYNYLSTRLATYMLPRYIDVVESLPTTETQKIQKNLLRALPIDDATWEAPQRLRAS